MESATDWEIERGLRSTVAYPANDPDVKALMREAIGDATDPREMADLLAHFVHRYLEYSDEEPLSVLETIDERQGDCSNFSALYVTLARSAGLPSRLVDGLSGGAKSFGWHSWCETAIDGVWVPVDPTYDEGPYEVDGTHVRFDDERGHQEFAMHILSQSQIQVISVQLTTTGWFRRYGFLAALIVFG